VTGWVGTFNHGQREVESDTIWDVSFVCIGEADDRARNVFEVEVDVMENTVLDVISHVV
jgi:hypothetical protein